MSGENTSEVIWGAPLSIKAAHHVAFSSGMLAPSGLGNATTNGADDFSGDTAGSNSSLFRGAATQVFIGRNAEQISHLTPVTPTRFPVNRQLELHRYNSSGLSVSLNTEILERCRKRFVQIAASEDIEYGIISPSEILLNEYFERYGSMIGEIVQHIYLSEISKKAVLIALLKSLSSRRYKTVYPYAQTIAVAALASQNPEVREAGIRAFENWGHPEGIDVLKALVVTPQWLDDYRLDTIDYLESIA